MPTPEDAYNELRAYTLQLGDANFVHQHVVDVYAAQHANEATKPITVAFALAGLYLFLERGFTGRQVQQAHMRIAGEKRVWPPFVLPADRGAVTVADVMAVPAGAGRDEAIHAWCASVWEAFADQKGAVVEFLHPYGLA